MPELAKEVRPDAILATGRSDYPNQVNNVLCFPFIFRGALDCGAKTINEAMKQACVKAIADLAMKEAIARAELYAAASGYEVARVVTISESGGMRPQPMQMMAEARAMDRATPIASRLMATGSARALPPNTGSIRTR